MSVCLSVVVLSSSAGFAGWEPWKTANKVASGNIGGAVDGTPFSSNGYQGPRESGSQLGRWWTPIRGRITNSTHVQIAFSLSFDEGRTWKRQTDMPSGCFWDFGFEIGNNERPPLIGFHNGRGQFRTIRMNNGLRYVFFVNNGNSIEMRSSR